MDLEALECFPGVRALQGQEPMCLGPQGRGMGAVALSAS